MQEVYLEAPGHTFSELIFMIKKCENNIIFLPFLNYIHNAKSM